MKKIIQTIFILVLLLSFFAICVSEEALDPVPEEEALYTSVTETNIESTEYDDTLAESDSQPEQTPGTADEIDTVVYAEQATDVSVSANALDDLGDTSAQTEEANVSVSPAQEPTDTNSDPVVFSAKITIEVYPAGDILENTIFSFSARVNDANMEYTLRWEEHDTTKDRPGVAPSWKKIGEESVIRLTADLGMNTIEYHLVVTGVDGTEIIVPVKPFDIIPASEPEETPEVQNDDQGPAPADDTTEEAEESLCIVETETVVDPAEGPETAEEPVEGQPEDHSEPQVDEVAEELPQEQTDEVSEDFVEAKPEETVDERKLEEAAEELLEAVDEEDTAEGQTLETTDEIDGEPVEGPVTEPIEDIGEPIEETLEDPIPDIPETDTAIQDEPVPTVGDALTEEPADETEPEIESEADPEAGPADDSEYEPEETEIEPGDQPEEPTADTKTPAEEPVRKVTVRSSAGDCIMSGATIVLTVELDGFEANDDVTVIWEVNKGDGWEMVGVGETYEYTASLESIMWDFRVKVQYELQAESDALTL